MKMTTRNKFDKVFNSVMEKHHISKWWELFDSILFDEVEKKCRRYIKTEEDQKDYDDWYSEMSEDM